ncbi:MAG: tetratricopeptide repeat protein [Gammaproteobacteria bacterium]|nr:tetratricopeptide repeat protein [Gammaproteobacteria bacterium]MDH3415579.1 tetratricopeptide repeat protein [Gammaproteobacteria bacterium]
MIRDAKFWISMAVFQVFFGFAVFAITRDYYAADTHEVISQSRPVAVQSGPAWPNAITAAEIDRLSLPALGDLAPQDPVEIYRQANEFFANKRYEKAAEYYEQLLAFRPNDAEIHNNLGITLHYLGRSDEALERLNKGITVDPEHQRSWLTLGFVNSQLGNTGQARSALTNATQIGTNESIRQSAFEMLESLP